MEISGARQVFDGYRIADSENIQNSSYIFASRDCLNSSFLFDCRNVSDSFFAWNRRHGKYFWLNEQLSKDEYQKRLLQINLSSRATLKEYENKFFNLVGSTADWPENFNLNALESSGEYLVNVQCCENCFLCWNGARNLYWVMHGYNRAEDCAFVAGTYGSSKIYESCTVADSSDCKFCFHIVQSRSMEYCMQCFNCENCFGCVGLQRKKFYIFNQAYSESEYWQKVDEIKCAMLERGEYGFAFPLSTSYSYLPQSGPGLYFATEEKDYALLGGKLFDPESCGAIGSLALDRTPLSIEEIPDRLDDKSDDLAGKSIFDFRVNRRFAFLKPEIDFYRSRKLPLPDEHFISRVQKIMSTSNTGIFENQICKVCGKIIRAAKNKLFPNKKIYCHLCYLKYLEENN